MKFKGTCSVKQKMASSLGIRMLDKSIKNTQQGKAWWHESIIPVLWRQRHVSGVSGQPGLVPGQPELLK